jgi:hypothetical protein
MRQRNAGCNASRRRVSGYAGTLLVIGAGALAAQIPQAQPVEKAKKPYNPPPVFSAATPLEFTLHAPFTKLRRDRQDSTPYRQAFITYATAEGSARVPVRARTRGIWRKKNCEIPPILLNFTKDSTKGSEFGKVDRLRLSLHCKNTDEYEQYVLQEFQLYRVQRLLTPLSFDVRLAKVTYVDSEKGDTLMTRYAFLQEQDDAFADRIDAKLMEQKGAGPGDIDPYESAFFGVFQYFVANSDYSIRELHNVVLLFKEPNYVPVARDFDWSGAVNARYAKPNPILQTRVITERVMRGYCAPQHEYEKVFELFRAKKDAIYGLYRDEIGSELKPNVVASTLKYFDEFYEIINDPKKAQRYIIGACLGGSA